MANRLTWWRRLRRSAASRPRAASRIAVARRRAAAGTVTASVHRAPRIERGSSSSERGGGLGDAARLGADASAAILAPPLVDSVASNASSSAATCARQRGVGRGLRRWRPPP